MKSSKPQKKLKMFLLLCASKHVLLHIQNCVVLIFKWETENYYSFRFFFSLSIYAYLDSRHAANKMDENNVIVGDSLLLESDRPQANSPVTVANKQTDMNKVGQSVFYDCLELSPTAEKQDFMKPEQSDTDEESKFPPPFLSLVSVKFFFLFCCCFFCTHVRFKTQSSNVIQFILNYSALFFN